MVVRQMYLALGIVCVGLGFVGLVLPVMPGFVFFVLALACFRRSSKPFEEWLLNRSPVAGGLREWEEHRAMRPRTKRVAVATLWTAIAVSVLVLVRKRQVEWSAFFREGSFHPMLAVPPLLLIIAVGVTIYILSRKTLAPSGT